MLRGENRLLYTYGVTNSGKTYTIQGKTSPVLLCLGHICLKPSLDCSSACSSLDLQFLSAGIGQEAGLLPRALVSLFRKLQGRLYGAMDLKPVMYQDVRQLDAGEVRAEEIRRNSLLNEVIREIIFRGPMK